MSNISSYHKISHINLFFDDCGVNVETVVISYQKMEWRFVFFDQRKASLFLEEDII